MPRVLYIISIVMLFSCGGTKSLGVKNDTPLPEITFDKETIGIGDMVRGDIKEIQFNFTNTGDADLEIDLITACKCTSTDWTRGKIPPGGRGKLSVTFDSKDQKGGELKKTIDIIANTDPIVVECFFTANIIQ